MDLFIYLIWCIFISDFNGGGGRPLRTYWESERVSDVLFGNGATLLSFRLKRQEVCDAMDFNLIPIPLLLFLCILPSSKDLLIWLFFFFKFASEFLIHKHTYEFTIYYFSNRSPRIGKKIKRSNLHQSRILPKAIK